VVTFVTGVVPSVAGTVGSSAWLVFLHLADPPVDGVSVQLEHWELTRVPLETPELLTGLLLTPLLTVTNRKESGGSGGHVTNIDYP